MRLARRLWVALEGAFDEVETLDTELACRVGIYGELLDVALRRRIALEGAGFHVESEVVLVTLSCSIMTKLFEVARWRRVARRVRTRRRRRRFARTLSSTTATNDEPTTVEDIAIGGDCSTLEGVALPRFAFRHTY